MRHLIVVDDPKEWPMAPFPYICDLSLFLNDNNGPYMLNWPVKVVELGNVAWQSVKHAASAGGSRFPMHWLAPGDLLFNGFDDEPAAPVARRRDLFQYSRRNLYADRCGARHTEW